MSQLKPPAKLAISSGGQNLPSKGILLGVPGIGKTAVAAQAPKPIFLMTRGENGLETLIDNGIVGQTPHFPEVNDWLTLLQALDWLLVADHGYTTFVLDTLNGAERLCFEHVVSSTFGGSWDKFQAYGKGPEASLAEWLKLIGLMHRINTQRKMLIFCLAHCRIKTFKNPEGEDYDRYSAELHDKTWGMIEKWADLILFANYDTHPKKDNGAMKAKGYGGTQRFFHTQRTAAYDAKNRFGLDPEIPMGDAPTVAWANLVGAIKSAKQKHVQAPVTSVAPEPVTAN